DDPALWIIEEDGSEKVYSYDLLRRRSNQVANLLRRAGVQRGSHVMVMLNNQVELWETMLAGIRLGAVLLPTTVQLGPIDLQDRAERGRADFVVANPADSAKFDEVDHPVVRIVVDADGDTAPDLREGDVRYSAAADESEDFTVDGPTRADDLLLLYFT